MTLFNPSISGSRRSAGFGLVELMVALTIGLLLALAIGEIYVVMRRGEATLNHLSELQESARFISERIKRDARMAGYYGGTYQRWDTRQTADPDFQLPLSSKECFQASDANVSFRWAVPLVAAGSEQPPPKLYGADGAGAFTNCLSTPLSPNSDVLSLHYAGPIARNTSELSDKKYYLQSSVLQVFGFYCGAGKSGLACLPGDRPPVIAGTEFHELTSRIYYVRDYARAPDDGIPTLMVGSLMGGSVQNQPLVEGVAVFQVQYGLDDDGDGVVDRYQDASAFGGLTAATLANWNRIKTIAVSFVLRSVEEDRSRLQSNPEPSKYSIGGVNYSIDGRYMSREYQITVALRNPSDRAGGV